MMPTTMFFFFYMPTTTLRRENDNGKKRGGSTTAARLPAGKWKWRHAAAACTTARNSSGLRSSIGAPTPVPNSNGFLAALYMPAGRIVRRPAAGAPPSRGGFLLSLRPGPGGACPAFPLWVLVLPGTYGTAAIIDRQAGPLSTGLMPVEAKLYYCIYSALNI